MDDNYSKGHLYLLALATTFLLLMGRCIDCNLYYFIEIFYQIQRQTLTMIIYEKVSKVSEYVIRSKEVGKIYNLVSSDFNIL